VPDNDADIRFAILPIVGQGARTSEFARTMASHPLVYQEIPYEPRYTSTTAG
jgi:hypothetical protein